MNDEVSRLKRKIRVIDPLRKKNELDLNRVSQDLRQRQVEYDKSLDAHAELTQKKQVIVDYIHDYFGDNKSLNVHDMNNVRHYLDSLDTEVVKAVVDLEHSANKVEAVKKVVVQHQLSRKLYEKTQSMSKSKLSGELEKLQMKEMDDMWSRKNFTEK